MTKSNDFRLFHFFLCCRELKVSFQHLFSPVNFPSTNQFFISFKISQKFRIRSENAEKWFEESPDFFTVLWWKEIVSQLNEIELYLKSFQKSLENSMSCHQFISSLRGLKLYAVGLFTELLKWHMTAWLYLCVFSTDCLIIQGAISRVNASMCRLWIPSSDSFSLADMWRHFSQEPCSRARDWKTT